METSTADPCSRSSRITSIVASTPERVDAVERLVEQQDVGVVEGGEHDRHPPAHAVGEAGGDPVGGAAEVEAVEQVLGPLAPSPSGSPRSVAASWRCSHGVARGIRPPTSGQ